MANFLKLTSYGHGAGADINKIESNVTSDLDYFAHVSNPQHAASDIVDRAQQAESDVVAKGKIELPLVTHIPVTHTTSAVSHTWNVVEKKPIVADHIAIPVHVPPNERIPGSH